MARALLILPRPRPAMRMGAPGLTADGAVGAPPAPVPVFCVDVGGDVSPARSGCCVVFCGSASGIDELGACAIRLDSRLQWSHAAHEQEIKARHAF